MLNKNTFRSLRHRNFRIYYIGQLVSLNGTWMQATAQSWLIYRLTGSGLMLGLVGSMTLLPNLVFGLYGGWLADRFSRQKMLILIHTLAMAQAAVMGVLTIGGWIEAWHIILLALTLGLVQAVETPVRQSFISQLVARQELPNAIALSSSLFHLSRFIGPALAGVLVVMFGEGPVFIINAVTFIAVLISLFSLKLPAMADRQGMARGLRSIWSGFHYAREHQLIRSLLALVATTSLLGGSAMVLLPIFVAEVYGRGPEGLGIFLGTLGSGSLLAALMLAGRNDYRLLERRVAIAGILVGTCLLVFSFNQFYLTAFVILFVTGFSSTTVFASSNALIQLAVPDHLRGRVMALFTICLHGMTSLGQLTLGLTADVIGARLTLGISAGVLFILALWLAVVLNRVEQ